MRIESKEFLKKVALVLLILAIPTMACGVLPDSPAVQAVQVAQAAQSSQAEQKDSYTAIALIPKGGSLSSAYEACVGGSAPQDFIDANGGKGVIVKEGQEFLLPSGTRCFSKVDYKQALEQFCIIAETSGNYNALSIVASEVHTPVASLVALNGANGPSTVVSGSVRYPASCTGFDASDTLGLNRAGSSLNPALVAMQTNQTRKERAQLDNAQMKVQ
ncbi:MAG: hypothetical protein NUV65_02685 [Candidatus Roizmanbacteria bacterium]|nr:hypothetical protein [Candidatus Roizmanbacteria bacterium]